MDAEKDKFIKYKLVIGLRNTAKLSNNISKTSIITNVLVAPNVERDDIREKQINYDLWEQPQHQKMFSMQRSQFHKQSDIVHHSYQHQKDALQQTL